MLSAQASKASRQTLKLRMKSVHSPPVTQCEASGFVSTTLWPTITTVTSLSTVDPQIGTKVPRLTQHKAIIFGSLEGKKEEIINVYE